MLSPAKTPHPVSEIGFDGKSGLVGLALWQEVIAAMVSFVIDESSDSDVNGFQAIPSPRMRAQANMLLYTLYSPKTVFGHEPDPMGKSFLNS
jgi:hypothetical protein